MWYLKEYDFVYVYIACPCVGMKAKHQHLISSSVTLLIVSYCWLTNPGVYPLGRLTVNSEYQPISTPYAMLMLQAHKPHLAFKTWLLGIRIKVLMAVWQVLYKLNHYPHPTTFNIVVWKWAFIIHIAPDDGIVQIFFAERQYSSKPHSLSPLSVYNKLE